MEVKGCETQNRALGNPLFEMCCVHFQLGEGGGGGGGGGAQCLKRGTISNFLKMTFLI